MYVCFYAAHSVVCPRAALLLQAALTMSIRHYLGFLVWLEWSGAEAKMLCTRSLRKNSSVTLQGKHEKAQTCIWKVTFQASGSSSLALYDSKWLTSNPLHFAWSVFDWIRYFVAWLELTTFGWQVHVFLEGDLAFCFRDCTDKASHSMKVLEFP